MLLDMFLIAFPNNCIGCKTPLIKKEKYICLSCFIKIPFLADLFVDAKEYSTVFKTKNTKIGGLFSFDKKDITQLIIHEIKYNENLKLAEYFGKIIGGKIKKLNCNIDIIIPVPIHKKKLKKRGYNQAEIIAKGISNKLNIPLLSNILIKHKSTDTQTKKNRIQRIENVANSLTLTSTSQINGKTILLVDDVITTGSTVNECVKVLSKANGVSFFIISLGIVNN